MAGSPLVYAIFEGGGAKGIAHLGAVEAVNRLGLTFAGVAGASAGAFVAALLAVGYRSEELLSPDNPRTNLLATHGLKPLDLLGLAEWKKFSVIRASITRLKIGAMLDGIFGALYLAPRSAVYLNKLRKENGHFSTSNVRAFLNICLRERLRDILALSGQNPDKLNDPVRFLDLEYEKYSQLRPLKIIATDVLNMRPVLFDRVNTPEVPICDAVAASIAIPLFFKPVRVRGLPAAFGNALFLDGGLVSNLPFWVFSEEKTAFERTYPLDPPVPIVAFTLVEAQPPQPTEQNELPFFQLIAQSVRSGIFGSQIVAKNLLRDLVQAPLVTRLPTLGFDRPWQQIRADYISGRQCAMRHLRNALQRKPEIISAYLLEMTQLTLARVNTLRTHNGRSTVDRLRTCVMEPFGAQSLRITYTYNMDEDADDRLTLDRRTRGAGDAFTSGDLVIVTFQEGERHRFMTKYERALVRPTLHSTLCIPIFSEQGSWELAPAARPAPRGVVAFDSDHDLSDEFRDGSLLQAIVERTVLISRTLDSE